MSIYSLVKEHRPIRGHWRRPPGAVRKDDDTLKIALIPLTGGRKQGESWRKPQNRASKIRRILLMKLYFSASLRDAPTSVLAFGEAISARSVLTTVLLGGAAFCLGLLADARNTAKTRSGRPHVVRHEYI